MPSHYIECPRCGVETKVDDSALGSRVTCADCGESFTAEVGGSYDVVPDERPRPAKAGPDGPKAKPGPDGPKGKPARPKPKADPELEKLMEKWAEE